MSQDGKTPIRGNLPLVNQYFTQSSDCHSNFFDDISSSSDSSAFMRSVVGSNSSSDLFHAASNSNSANTTVSVTTEKQEDCKNGIGKGIDIAGKEEPVVCRIFSSQENITKQIDGGSGRDFFDMIGSHHGHSIPGASVKSSPSLPVDFSLGISSGPTSLIQAPEFNPGSKFINYIHGSNSYLSNRVF